MVPASLCFCPICKSGKPLSDALELRQLTSRCMQGSQREGGHLARKRRRQSWSVPGVRLTAAAASARETVQQFTRSLALRKLRTLSRTSDGRPSSCELAGDTLDLPVIRRGWRASLVDGAGAGSGSWPAVERREGRGPAGLNT